MTTEEMVKQVTAMLTRYGFVQVSEPSSLNEIEMHLDVGDMGDLSVWARGWNLNMGGISLVLDQGIDTVVSIVNTRDLTLLEAAVQHSITFVNTINSLKPAQQHELSPYDYARASTLKNLEPSSVFGLPAQT